MNDDDLFEQYAQRESVDEWLGRRSAGYEERMVKRVLEFFNLKEHNLEYQRRCKAFSGNEQLTFSWFTNEHPDFPVMLGARFIPYVHKLTLEEMYKRFTKTSIYKAWDELRLSAPDAQAAGRIGLIFPWPGLGDTILHNYAVEHVDGLSGLRVIWHGEYGLALDPLYNRAKGSGFLPILGTRWGP